MRRIFTLLLLAILMSLFYTSNVSAGDELETTLINEYEEDVTGDGIKEVIKLYGVLLSSDSEYYRDISAVIQTKSGKEWEINYKGGYDPELKFVDLTHNNVNDILFQSKGENRNEFNNYNLHTIEQNELTEYTLPSQSASGKFINDFKAELSLNPNTEPINLDLEKNKEEYIQAGIYDQQGQLLEEKSLFIHPISFFEPLFISESKGYGLKSQQKISGTKDSNQLGSIETLWYYENDRWIILQTNWKPLKQ